MTSEAMPAPLNAKEAKLMTAIADELMKISVNITPGSCMYFAGYLARRVVKEGWQWHPSEFPDPTPAQEKEIINRIISGLPMEYVKPTNPNGNAVYEKEPKKLYDVNSLHPEEFKLTPNMKLTHERKSEELIAAANSWRRIPEFDNYEITPLGVIRNRWTKRVLEVAEDGGQKYVAMHDKDGFDHDVNVSFVIEKVYGK